MAEKLSEQEYTEIAIEWVREMISSKELVQSILAKLIANRDTALERRLSAEQSSHDEIASTDEGTSASAVRSLAALFAAKEAECARLREALIAVRDQVYCQNDHTTRDHEKYYAAIELMRAAIAVSRKRDKRNRGK